MEVLESGWEHFGYNLWVQMVREKEEKKGVDENDLEEEEKDESEEEETPKKNTHTDMTAAQLCVKIHFSHSFVNIKNIMLAPFTNIFYWN